MLAAERERDSCRLELIERFTIGREIPVSVDDDEDWDADLDNHKSLT